MSSMPHNDRGVSIFYLSRLHNQSIPPILNQIFDIYTIDLYILRAVEKWLLSRI